MQFKSKKQKTDFYSLKINILKVGFLFFAIVIVGRLYYIQIVNGDEFRDTSLRQGILNTERSERGIIYFESKDGNLIPAAVNKSGFILAINPKILKNKETVFEKLSRIIEIDHDDFFKKASKLDDPYEILAEKIEKDKIQKIKEIQDEHNGIILVPQKWRFYPAKNLASHILGFVGFEDNEIKGRYGVEKYYENYLKGGSPVKSRVMFGSLLDFGKRVFESYELMGASIVLTVEPMLQGVLEANLEKVLSDYKGIIAGGIIINPQNGKILAMAAKPDFDPNEYHKIRNISVFNNPLTGSIYEVGSIFKPLTIAAGLNENAITPETKYFDRGYTVLNHRKIENYDGKGRGEVDIQTILNKSLNTGAVFVMQALGKEKFLNYIKNYGLNSKTDIDLPGEIAGKTDNLNTLRDIEFATASFGQGIAITPIEFAVAASSLGNGGKIIKPRIADKMMINDGIVYGVDDKKDTRTINFETKIKGQSIKKEISEKISSMLTKVVDEALLNGTVKIDNYSIAAKTGTAQLINMDKKGYSEDFLHTFVGYAPSFEPEFLIVMFIEKPKGVKYASETLTVPFMNIMKFIINYYEIPPDR